MEAILIVLFAVTLLALPMTMLWAWSIVGSGAPFVPVPRQSMPGILDALDLRDGDVLVDLGCGDGRLLFAAVERANVQAIGIEIAFFPWAIASIRRAIHPKKQQITLHHASFFNIDLKAPNKVVCYLFPGLVDKLDTKLAQDLRLGTKIVAIDFPFTHRKPTSVIEQRLPKGMRGKDLYVYEV